MPRRSRRLRAPPPALAPRPAVPRPCWQLRRARALLLAGGRPEAAAALGSAAELAGGKLPGLHRLQLAASVPSAVLQAAVRAKQWLGEDLALLGRGG